MRAGFGTGFSARERQSGGLMLGMAGLIAVLAVLSSTVLYRSLDAYRSSRFHTTRLQATAAAEGAAVAWRTDPGAAREALVLGESRVIPAVTDSAAADTTSALTLPFRVEVMRGERSVYAAGYAAHYAPAAAPGSGWKLTRLEVLP